VFFRLASKSMNLTDKTAVAITVQRFSSVRNLLQLAKIFRTSKGNGRLSPRRLSFCRNASKVFSIVCRLSVTFVHPTQGVKIFGINFRSQYIEVCFYFLGTKFCDLEFSASPRTTALNIGTPCGQREFYRKRCKIEGMLQVGLLINRKSLEPKSVTLNDLERRNGH